MVYCLDISWHSSVWCKMISMITSTGSTYTDWFCHNVNICAPKENVPAAPLQNNTYYRLISWSAGLKGWPISGEQLNSITVQIAKGVVKPGGVSIFNIPLIFPLSWHRKAQFSAVVPLGNVYSISLTIVILQSCGSGSSDLLYIH